MFSCKGVVGDIFGYFMQVDGVFVVDMQIYQELIGILLIDLKNIFMVIGVVGGVEKFEVIVVVLKGKYVNVLVIDELIVRLIIKLI